MNYTTKALPESEMQFTISITTDAIQAHYATAIKAAIANFAMDGFRPGTVPEKIVLQKVGSMRIWEDAVREAIPSLYIQALTESKIPAIGRPHFTISKIADQSDAEVIVTTAVIPDVTLPDYTAIAKEVYTKSKTDPVTDTDIATAVLELRRLRHERDTKNEVEFEEKLDEDGDPMPPTKKEIPEAELPELTQEYLSGFGTGITDSATLGAKMRHNLEHERIHQFEDKKRAELVTKLLDSSSFEVPMLLVDHEIDMMMRQYEHDLSMSGVSLEDYLKYTNKTREDLRNDVRESARRRAATQLLIEKLSETAQIKADADRVDKELSELQTQYAGNKEFSQEHAKSYLEQVYTNQAVFAYLEKLGGYDSHDHEKWSNNER